MTERINLDELDAGSEDEKTQNAGDWFWREEGDPEDDQKSVAEINTAESRTADVETTADSETTDTAANTVNVDSEPIPRVPRENENKPAGIPVESGGSGAGAGEHENKDTRKHAAATVDADERENTTKSVVSEDTSGASHQPLDATANSEASGPHGGGADDMTLAFTYEAATRLSDFGRVAADTYGWADWVGVVGHVPAHVINKFQRDRNVDLDFFNGSARGPAERLAAINHHSMFYADRMVVVGVAGENEQIAERTDWEFIPLAEAAEKADWKIDEQSDLSE